MVKIGVDLRKMKPGLRFLAHSLEKPREYPHKQFISSETRLPAEPL